MKHATIYQAKEMATTWAEYLTVDNLGFSAYWSKKPSFNGFWYCEVPYLSQSGPYIHGEADKLVKVNP